MKGIFSISALFLGLILVSTVSLAREKSRDVVSPTIETNSFPATKDKPGFFRLDKSTNDNVCSSLARMINADIEKFGNTRFNDHREIVKWHNVNEKDVDRGDTEKYDGPIFQTDIDINNDGVKDRVIKTKWSIRGALNDALYVLPKIEAQKLIVPDFLKSDRQIIFNSGNYWISRHLARYGESNFDWLFDGVASIDLFHTNNETYVVAQNYAAPRRISAKIFVFKLDKNYKESDVCMFRRTCPCGGCTDLRGDEAIKTLPAKEWCRN